jgi:hypothetical protein
MHFVEPYVIKTSYRCRIFSTKAIKPSRMIDWNLRTHGTLSKMQPQKIILATSVKNETLSRKLLKVYNHSTLIGRVGVMKQPSGMNLSSIKDELEVVEILKVTHEVDHR